MKLKLNSKAPDFKLFDKNNNEFTLYGLKSKYIVLYFYPKDNTPGCTTEAIEFNNLKKDFEKKGVIIIGISGGDNKSKQKFCDNNNLNITLLSDTIDNSVGKNYGVYGKKKFMGREYMGYFRTTFLLNKDKEIIEILENVKAKGHAKEIFDKIN